MHSNSAELDKIERWFLTSITCPKIIAANEASELLQTIGSELHRRVEDIVLPSKQLSSSERLSIYADMYFERLVDVLKDEFPTVRHILGPRQFARIAELYVAHHPSTHYSLVHLGRKFPQFLRDDCGDIPLSVRSFSAAVATVERAMEDVFDAAESAVLQKEDLAVIPADAWSGIRFRLIPALRLLTLAYPVNTYMNAVREQRSADVPKESPSYVVVYRQNYQVWRMDLDYCQFTILTELQKGENLGNALSACAKLPGGDIEKLGESLHSWFQSWTAAGFVHKIDA